MTINREIDHSISKESFIAIAHGKRENINNEKIQGETYLAKTNTEDEKRWEKKSTNCEQILCENKHGGLKWMENREILTVSKYCSKSCTEH